MKKRKDKMIIVSGCLLGLRCRYDGKSKSNKKVIEFLRKKNLIPIPVCPEQFGGQETPRPDAAIFGGNGKDVLSGKAKVIEEDGKEVTACFIRGAREVLKLVELLNIREAILKTKSPSCGCGLIHDGTFTGNLVPGDGVTTALLKQKGIRIKTEEDL